MNSGWVGCNILLHKIPADARIPIVDEGKNRPGARTRIGKNACATKPQAAGRNAVRSSG